MKKIITVPLFALTLVTLSFFFLSVSAKKKIDWDELKSFKIYDTKSLPITEEFQLDYSELDSARFVEMNVPRTIEILKQSKRLGKRLYLWKGYHYGVAEFNNGERIRLKISTYDCFLMDLNNNCIYQIKNSMVRKSWDILLRNAYTKLYGE